MDLSILIAGMYEPIVCIKTAKVVRKLFPNAEVILSTWQGENVPGDIFDKVFFSEKLNENYVYSHVTKKQNNVNSQITSVVAGLKKAKGDYILKIRSDFLLNGKSFLDFWDKMPKVENEFQIFKHKILDCSYFTRDPRADVCSHAYHPSDMILFGLKEDLLNLFDVSLMTKEEAYYNLNADMINHYVPEQHIFINCLKKNGKHPKCEFYNDVNKENIIETERYFASNFIFLSYKQFGVVPPAKFKSLSYEYQTCITHVEGERLYKKYVDPDYVVFARDLERKRITKLYSVSSTKVCFVRLISRIVSMFLFGKRNKSLRQKIRRKIQSLFEPKFF